MRQSLISIGKNSIERYTSLYFNVIKYNNVCLLFFVTKGISNMLDNKIVIFFKFLQTELNV
jgi:hypothetical protein